MVVEQLSHSFRNLRRFGNHKPNCVLELFIFNCINNRKGLWLETSPVNWYRLTSTSGWNASIRVANGDRWWVVDLEDNFSTFVGVLQKSVGSNETFSTWLINLPLLSPRCSFCYLICLLLSKPPTLSSLLADKLCRQYTSTFDVFSRMFTHVTRRGSLSDLIMTIRLEANYKWERRWLSLKNNKCLQMRNLFIQLSRFFNWTNGQNNLKVESGPVQMANN